MPEQRKPKPSGTSAPATACEHGKRSRELCEVCGVEIPEPAFRLKWRGDRAAYYVDKPNIGDTDCYTADQLRAAAALGKRQ